MKLRGQRGNDEPSESAVPAPKVKGKGKKGVTPTKRVRKDALVNGNSPSKRKNPAPPVENVEEPAPPVETVQEPVPPVEAVEEPAPPVEAVGEPTPPVEEPVLHVETQEALSDGMDTSSSEGSNNGDSSRCVYLLNPSPISQTSS